MRVNLSTMLDLRFFYIVKKMMRWVDKKPSVKFENDHQSALAGNKRFLDFGKFTDRFHDYELDGAIGLYVMKTYPKYFSGADIDMGLFVKSQGIALPKEITAGHQLAC